MKSMTLLAALALALHTIEADAEMPDPSAGATQVAADAEATGAAIALITHVLPGHVSVFECEIIPREGGKDLFEIEAKGNKIVLCGDNGVALATAFNWYLRHEYKTNFDWLAAGPLKIDRIPPPPHKRSGRNASPRNVSR